MSTQKQFPVLLNVDISETDNTVEVEADITGFSADNVKVSTWQDSLIIETKSAHEPSQSYYLGELEPETYRRVIPLGFVVSETDMNMKYSHGTLRIGVPKPNTQVFSSAQKIYA